MSFNFLGSRPRSDPDRIAAIKRWAAEAFALASDTPLMVAELRCTEPGCPPLETVVAILDVPGKPRQHKIHKGIAEVTQADVLSLASAPPGKCQDCDCESEEPQ